MREFNKNFKKSLWSWPSNIYPVIHTALEWLVHLNQLTENVLVANEDYTQGTLSGVDVAPQNGETSKNVIKKRKENKKRVKTL